MKGKTKVLILLAIAVMVVGGFYLSPTGAEQPKGFPSLGTVATGTPELAITKPGVPGPQKGLNLPTASLGAYPLSTAAVKPAKVAGYQPPHHSVLALMNRQGGETCALATAIGSLPYSVTGTTSGYTNDYDEVCPYSGSTSPDVVYSYTPGSNITVDIDLYGSYYDTKVYVYQGTCSNAYLVACNDDYYPDYTSAIMNLPLSGGYTYYIVVDGYGGSSGSYVFNLSAFQPCDVVCPGDGVPEGEPNCGTDYVDMYNGGCNSSPFVFQTINCNTTICGTSGTYLYTGLNYRDTDWFRVVITSPTTLTWKAVAEFPVLIFVINGGTENCSDYTILGSLTANACDTATLTFDVQPGVYWLWVGPSVFDGYPCPLEYVAKLTCFTATTGACCNNFDPYDCALLTPAECAGLPDHTFRGLGTNCGPPNPCLPGPPNDECTGAIAVTVPDCPNVVTVSGTTVGANIDCPGVLDWNSVWYSFYLPYAANKLTIDFCPTAIPIYQVGVVLYNSCPVNCSNYILYSGVQWVTCPNSNTGPQIWWSGLPAGTYYFPVAVWDYSMNPFMDFTFTACVEPLQAPANDNCANATPVGDVSNLPFSTESATFDGPGSCQYAPNIWYCYTATCNGNAYVGLCGSLYDTKLAAYDGCTCWGPMLACNDDACGGYLQSEISFPVVMGQQYLIEVGGYGSAIGSGVMSISCGLAPPNDECTGAPIINTFPQTVSGTTIGAGVDCPDILAWNAVWYQFDLPYNCNKVTVNFCPTYNNINTVGIVLYNSCPPDCPSYILSSGYQWLNCPNGYYNPEVYWSDLPAGSYWFPVYLGVAMDFSFEVSVEECLPCDVVCPPGAMMENEPTCYDGYIDNYNGGCNSSPYIWQDISCNTWVCGTSGVYDANYNRDTDWYRVEVSEGTLTWKVVAEFPLLIFLIDAGSENCSDYSILGYTTAAKCDTAVLSMYVPAGVYWLWAGPSDWGNYPCGVEYVGYVECVGLGPQISVTPTSFNQTLEPGQTADASMLIKNVGSENLEYEIDYNLANTWLGVSPRFGTIPPAGTDNINIHFDATSVGVGSYDDVLLIASNSTKQLNDTVPVPVHLEVAYAPDIDVAPTMSVGVIPGCTMEKPLRINNVGLGPLNFSASKKSSGMVGDILLVDDDNSINYPGDFTDVTSYFTAAITANGYTYDIFEVNTIGGNGPDAATMSAYPAVVWSCGESWNLSQTLTSTDEANLATYLNGGGNLFLSAHDYFYDRYPSAGSFSSGQFPYDYLGVTYASQDFWMLFYPSTGSCVGMPGSVAQGMSFDLWDPYTAKGQGSKGPDDGLYIDELTHNGVDLFQMINPGPAGIAACQYEGAGFKTVFTTIDFAGLTDVAYRSSKAEFMGAILEWFLGGGCPFTLAPNSGTVPPGGYLDVVLTIDGSAFTQCLDETLACDVKINSNDPDEPQVTVAVNLWSGRGDVFIPNCFIDIGDVVFLVNYILKNGPAPNPLCMGDCDPSHDGVVDVADLVYLSQFLFQKGAPPQVTPAAPGQPIQR